MKTTLWEIEQDFGSVVSETQESLDGISACLGRNYLKVYGDYSKYSSWINKLNQALNLIREVEESVYFEKGNHIV